MSTVYETVSGQQSAWKLLEKLGEGDAGEVYRVEGLLDNRRAILKRPHRSAFPSDMIRQATQIEKEGRLLRALDGETHTLRACRVRTPGLIDAARAGAEFSERFFIVIEEAPGVDLASLARLTRFGSAADEAVPQRLSPLAMYLADGGVLPEFLLLRIFDGLAAFLERIHQTAVLTDGLQQTGMVWNDIKPGHLFWDSQANLLTIIDWGNGAFLESDGASRDRRVTRLEDVAQFVSELGRFLQTESPALHQRLDWPEINQNKEGLVAAYPDLRSRLTKAWEADSQELETLRNREAQLLASLSESEHPQETLESIQHGLLALGELPNQEQLTQAAGLYAQKVLKEGLWAELKHWCIWMSARPAIDVDAWSLHARLAALGEAWSAEERADQTLPQLRAAMQAGLAEDWAQALWQLAHLPEAQRMADWWEPTSESLRDLAFDANAHQPAPFIAGHRVAHLLSAMSQKLESQQANGTLSPQMRLQGRALSRLLVVLRQDILGHWTDSDPPPPHGGVGYGDLLSLLESEGELIPPQARQSLNAALAQASAQAQIVLDAWNRLDFETARRGLRNILLWDPHRLRLLTADKALQSSPAWMADLANGPGSSAELPVFIQRMELRGREMRNQVGPAAWLERRLEALQQLRRGTSPAAVRENYTELSSEWLWLHESISMPAPVLESGSLDLARHAESSQAGQPTITARTASPLGDKGGVLITDALDQWTPEASGSSARVYQGFLAANGNGLRQAAIKLMRSDRMDYALPLFTEEVRVLARLAGVAGVNPLLETGFLRASNGTPIQIDTRTVNGRTWQGEAQRYPVEDAQAFLDELPGRLEQGWTPYLALEKQDAEDNLMVMCDAGYTRGRFLPVGEGLRAAVQMCEILAEAHARQIVYRDHKILHYYWRELFNGVYLIDWNVARLHEGGLSAEEIRFDLVQFAARALHHLFAGRPAPGALPLGPTRPEEIEAAQKRYTVQWTYDDRRLPLSVKEIIEDALAGRYDDASSLRQDLLQAFQTMSAARA